MPKISEMQSPVLPLSGLEMLPALQGGGIDANVGVPLLAYGGLPTGDVLALRAPMTADLSDTADADPGAGGVRWNNADPSLATMLYVSDDDSDAGSMASVWASLSVGGFVYVQASDDSERRDTWQKWQVTSVESATGYAKVGVSLQGGNGTFVDGEPVEFTAQQPTPSPGTDRNIVTTVTSVSGVLTLDASLGDYFKTTLHEDITSVVVTNVPPACTLSLRVTQDAVTPREVIFPASFLVRGGGELTIPSDLGSRSRVIFTTDDAGGTYDADIGEKYA